MTSIGGHPLPLCRFRHGQRARQGQAPSPTIATPHPASEDKEDGR